MESGVIPLVANCMVKHHSARTYPREEYTLYIHCGEDQVLIIKDDTGQIRVCDYRDQDSGHACK